MSILRTEKLKALRVSCVLICMCWGAARVFRHISWGLGFGVRVHGVGFKDVPLEPRGPYMDYCIT